MKLRDFVSFLKLGMTKFSLSTRLSSFYITMISSANNLCGLQKAGHNLSEFNGQLNRCRLLKIYVQTSCLFYDTLVT